MAIFRGSFLIFEGSFLHFGGEIALSPHVFFPWCHHLRLKWVSKMSRVWGFKVVNNLTCHGYFQYSDASQHPSQHAARPGQHPGRVPLLPPAPLHHPGPKLHPAGRHASLPQRPRLDQPGGGEELQRARLTPGRPTMPPFTPPPAWQCDHAEPSGESIALALWALTLFSPRAGGGGGGGGGAAGVCPPSTFFAISPQRAKVLPRGFMSFFLIVSRIFWDQTCDVRVYGYKVT